MYNRIVFETLVLEGWSVTRFVDDTWAEMYFYSEKLKVDVRVSIRLTPVDSVGNYRVVPSYMSEWRNKLALHSIMLNDSYGDETVRTLTRSMSKSVIEFMEHETNWKSEG